MTSTPPQPNHPAHTLLTRAHPPSQATQIFTSKLQKPLLLTTTTPTPSNTDKRSLRRKIRAHKARYHLQHSKPRPLSAREKRTLKTHIIPDSEIKYSIYAGLNALWKGYVLEVLGFMRDGVVVADAARRVVTQAGHGSLLASADFHGMEVEVVRCVDVGKVGIRGIVVRETKGSLVLVTERDQLRRVLKRGAVFRVVIELPQVGDGGEKREVVVELHGSQLEVRPVERAVRKFKWHGADYV